MKKKYLKKIILLFITFLFLYFVFVNLDLKELISIMKDFNIKYFFLLMLSVIISQSFRGLTFTFLMSKTAKLRLREIVPLCLTSSCLNIFLPARAGDIFRAFFVGQQYDINKIKVFGTVMLERIFDTISIFCLLALGIFIYHRNTIAVHLCTFAGFIIVVGILFVVITYRYNNTEKICNFIIDKTKNFPFAFYINKFVMFTNKTCNSFFHGFEVINSPVEIIKVILASFGIWIFECINFYIVIHGFGYNIHWSVSLFLIGFIALACMVPSTSIFIGPYQMAVISAFAIYDVNKEAALAISFIDQAGIMIISSVIAAIFLLKNNISLKELKEDIKKQ